MTDCYRLVWMCVSTLCVELGEGIESSLFEPGLDVYVCMCFFPLSYITHVP